jgi:DNA anti-recombination protein RmuC
MAVKSFDKFLEELKKIDSNLINESTANDLTEIFNAAVDIRAEEMKNELKEEMLKEATDLKEEMTGEAERLRDEIVTEATEFKEKLIDTIDRVLDETVNEFYEKYEDNITDDIKLVFYEKFFNDVKSSFEKHNFNLHESDIDVVSSLKKKLEEKDSELNEKIQHIYNLQDELLGEQVKVILNEKTKELTDMEKNKLFGLLEDVEFNSVEEAERKIDLFMEKFSDVDITINEMEETPIKITGKSDDNVAQKWASLI